ncbi:S8 family peptidase [Neisseria iguanae]|uniref:Autotransporter domain-containing protein n=1 Tax=Neisseria iguanae TaxID=90242 RepID=A0A2P7U0D4_9NEIS|nr:S8 family serine peptidase [Neisseria iguanae]PSJ80436.1 hypothetical protein C7N83_06205 [Neisseria iguanae]
MSNTHKLSKTFICITLGCLTQLAYANSTSSDPSEFNPQGTINLTDEIAARYTGKNVNIGIVDGGYTLDHPLIKDKKNIFPLVFQMENPKRKGKLDTFDPHNYITTQEESNENGKTKEITVYSQHGGQVLGIIGANHFAQDKLNYKGGIARNANFFIGDFDKEESMEPSKEKEKENPSLLLDKDTAYERSVITKIIDSHIKNNVLAINNSWNDNPVGDNAEEVDKRYKDAIANSKDNPLIGSIKNAVEKNVLMVFAAGNESKKQPGIFAALPRFLPELETNYLSVIAVNRKKELETYSNHCGVSKNWCVAAPGSLIVLDTKGAEKKEKNPSLSIAQGTSFAAPVVTGSLAILKERFNYFTPTQIRDTLLTTATDLGEKGIDEKYGWGVIDIKKAINGPSQLLNNETYTVEQDDVWGNDLAAKQQTLTKKGKGNLSLNGKSNQIKGIDIKEGALTLNGKTSTEQITLSSNSAVKGGGHLDTQVLSGNGTVDVNTKVEKTLMASGLTVNKTLDLHSGSQIIANSKEGVTASGNNAVVKLNGATVVLPQALTDNAKSGEELGKLITLKDKASLEGGFSSLKASKSLADKGLRADAFFKDSGVILYSSANKEITDAGIKTNNAKHGLKALNKLRDSKLALKAGAYNSWLQKAVQENNLQDLHYNIGNTIYADSLEFLRNQSARNLSKANALLHNYSNLSAERTKIWLDSGNEKQKTKNKHISEYADSNTKHLMLGAAHKLNNHILLSGSVGYAKTDMEKKQSSSRIKQTQANLALRYMPDASNWFVDIATKAANIKYNQTRRFGSVTGSTSGNNTGKILGGEARVGYNLSASGWKITPSIGLQAVRLNFKKLNENGSDFATKTGRFKQTDINLAGSLHVNKAFETGNGWTITPSADINYLHRLNNNKTAFYSSLADITTIRSEASADNRNQINAGLGVTLEKRKWFINANTYANLLKKEKGVSVGAKVGLKF